MTHVDEGVLQALLDGELPEEERFEVQAHLAGCPVCRAGLEEVRSASVELTGALALLREPAPRSRHYKEAAPRRRFAPRPQRATWGLARAAMLVLGFAAAASATIPGSPVRDWLTGLGRQEEVAVATRKAPAPESAPAVATEAAPADAPPEAGVSVALHQGEVQVVLTGASPELRVEAVLVDGDHAGVYARGEAASARFGTSEGRIEVDGAGAGELRVEIPRAARAATVTVNGERYLTKVGERLTPANPAQR